MLQFGNKEFRNLQEQVEKNKEDIESLRSGGIKISAWLTENQLAEYITEEHVGNYVIVSRSGVDHLYVITKRLNGGLIADDLGEYPKAIEGPQGEKGEQGDKGEPGREILSFGSQLPRAENFENGQLALLTAGIHKGRLSKVVDGQWVTQCSLIGPQGPIGENGTEVVGNPDNAANDTLTKIKIAGVTYKVNAMSDTDKEFLDSLREYIEIDESGNVTFGNGIYVDGDIETGGKVTAGSVDISGRIECGDDIQANGDITGNDLIGTTLSTDTIQSDTSTSLGQKVELGHFDASDNYWHMQNMKVDNSLDIAQNVNIGGVGGNSKLYINGEEVTPGGGTKKYLHIIKLNCYSGEANILIVNNVEQAYISKEEVAAWLWDNGYDTNNKFNTLINSFGSGELNYTNKKFVRITDTWAQSRSTLYVGTFTITLQQNAEKDVKFSASSGNEPVTSLYGDKVVALS